MAYHQLANFVITIATALSSVYCAEQRFIKQPQNTSVGAGSVAILDCTVENAIGKIQWMKDGFGFGTSRDLPAYPRYKIIGNQDLGEYRLMISNAQLEDDDKYDCQIMATESSPGLKSQTAFLTVLIPPDMPTIADGKTEVEVTAGTPYNLTCQANRGKPAANITWYLNGEPVTSDTYYSVTSEGKRENAESKLEINAGKTDGGKRYECRVINSALSSPLTVQTTIKVLYAPEVRMTVFPEKRVTEKGNIKLFCEGNSNPADIVWKWYRKNEVIPDETTNVLVLREVTREYHGNEVSCEATNKVGSTKESYTLNIEYGPTFTSEPKHTAINVGDDATLTCTVDGNPTPTVVWMRKGSGRILGSSNTLTLKAVRSSQFGIYTCKASVMGFPEIQQDVHLLKNGPPRIISNRVQFARYRESARIECNTISIPKPQAIIWKRDGQPLEIVTGGPFHIQEQDTPNGRKSILEISRVHAYDMGNYNCSITNSLGQDYLVIKLQVEDGVPLANILGGVFGALAVVLVGVLVIVFIYRRRITGGDSDTESSISSDPKRRKKEGTPELKVEYTNKYGSSVDQWRQDVDKNFHHHSPEYDELSYPSKDLKGSNNAYDPDYPDAGYGTYSGAPPGGYRENYPPEHGYHSNSPPHKYNDRYDPASYPPPATIEIRHHAPPPSDYLTDYAHTSVNAGHLSTNV